MDFQIGKYKIINEKEEEHIFNGIAISHIVRSKLANDRIFLYIIKNILPLTEKLDVIKELFNHDVDGVILHTILNEKLGTFMRKYGFHIGHTPGAQGFQVPCLFKLIK